MTPDHPRWSRDCNHPTHTHTEKLLRLLPVPVPRRTLMERLLGVLWAFWRVFCWRAYRIRWVSFQTAAAARRISWVW